MTVSVSTLLLRTSWGVISVQIENGLVTGCTLPAVGDRPASTDVRVCAMDARRVKPSDRPAARAAARFVRDALSGRAKAAPPVRFPEGSPMQQAVWRALSRLSRGHVISYGELARRVGRPKAARAAGQACGANPIPLFIPCHRVLAANGRIGGFSGGLAWKEWLLDREAVVLKPGRAAR